MARSYSVDEAESKLREILRSVKRGRTVRISERGQEIARVVPVAAPILGSGLDRLENTGQLTRGTGDIRMIRPIAHRPGALRRFLRSR